MRADTSWAYVWIVLLFLLALFASYRGRPNPIARQTAPLALWRLMLITGIDRVKCRDPRVLLYGENSETADRA